MDRRRIAAAHVQRAAQNLLSAADELEGLVRARDVHKLLNLSARLEALQIDQLELRKRPEPKPPRTQHVELTIDGGPRDGLLYSFDATPAELDEIHGKTVRMPASGARVFKFSDLLTMNIDQLRGSLRAHHIYEADLKAGLLRYKGLSTPTHSDTPGGKP